MDGVVISAWIRSLCAPFCSLCYAACLRVQNRTIWRVFPRWHNSFRLISLLLFSRGENLRLGDDEDGCRRLSLWRERDRLVGVLGWGYRRAQKQKVQHSESAAAWDFVRGTGSFSAQLQAPLSYVCWRDSADKSLGESE